MFSALLLISACLEPAPPGNTAAIFGINTAQAEIKSAADLSTNEVGTYEKLRARPINREPQGAARMSLGLEHRPARLAGPRI